MIGRLKKWSEALGSRELKVSRYKTKYVEYNFEEREYKAIREMHVVKFSVDVVEEVEKFKYLGSLLQRIVV